MLKLLLALITTSTTPACLTMVILTQDMRSLCATFICTELVIRKGDLQQELRPLLCSCSQEYPPGFGVAGPPGPTSVMIESLCSFPGANPLVT